MAQIMAQSRPDKLLQDEASEKKKSGNIAFKFNAQAPEFVPRSHALTPLPGYYYPSVQFLDSNGSGSSDWVYLGDQVQYPFHVVSASSFVNPNSSSKGFLTDDLRQRIVKQVEYQLSDMSLLANDSLMKQINKDQEGYVAISVIASSKKIKSLINNNHHLLVQALQYSSILIVSEDGKRVRRKNQFTDKDKEDLQARTVVAENLPEDHSHQNLEKIFNAVGSVKTIRIWHPQESNSSHPKGDYFIGNKLHALVEYETTEIAEKAVEKLNDERNWRKGLRVRLLLRCSPKSVLKSKKSDFNGLFEDYYAFPCESIEDSHIVDAINEENGDASPGASERGATHGRGRAKARARGHVNNVKAPLCSLPRSPHSATKGPRMPDGTRGFAMGRGKSISINNCSSE